MRIRDALRMVSIPVVLASLCCLSPVILVLVGLSTVSFASSLADTLYGDYAWFFRLTGVVALVFAYGVSLRKQGICTLDQVRRERNRVVNGFLLLLILGTLGYLIFLYGIVHFIGVSQGLWD
jgi:hypothetical protein